MSGVLGVGTDLADLALFRLRPYHDNPAFYHLVFTLEEQNYCLSRPDPAPHWAARFAAKEAVVKALAGRVRVAVPQVEVVKEASGQPSLRMVSRRGEATPEMAGLRLLVSLSHGTDFALAFVVVVAERDS